jgi:hypothetical protein
MNTSETQWKKSTFVSAAHVLHRPRRMPRNGKRLTSILRADKVRIKPDPVIIGAKQETIQVVPISHNGQVTALRVSCACGCESTFDIQYGAGGASNDIQNTGDSVHGGNDDQRMHNKKNNAA